MNTIIILVVINAGVWIALVGCGVFQVSGGRNAGGRGGLDPKTSAVGDGQ